VLSREARVRVLLREGFEEEEEEVEDEE